MISVIIPLYNKEKQIAHTLRSVLCQGFLDFEIIVVNDGSTDSSMEAVASVRDSRIRIIHQENAGVSASRNRGIAEAKYDLIAFLDADDEWHEDYLKTQFELTLRCPQCSVFACGYEFVKPDGSHAPAIIRKLPFEGEYGVLSNYFEVASCSHPPLWTSAVVVKKTAIEAVGGFPVGIRSGEDLLTWSRLACRYEIAYSRKVRARYVLATSSKNAPPPDMDPSEDMVAQQLVQLFSECRRDLRYEQMCGYLAFWFKMRARINLSLGNMALTRRCAEASVKAQLNAKGCVLWCLSWLPACVQQLVLKRLS